MACGVLLRSDRPVPTRAKRLLGCAQKVPGFAVGFVQPRSARALRADPHKERRFPDGEDEKDIVRNNIDHHEIHFARQVRDNAIAGTAVSLYLVVTPVWRGAALDLHPPEFVAFGPVAADENEVETFAVAVGFGDSEAEGGGFVGEGEFSELSAALGVELPLAGSLRAGRWGASGRRAAFWNCLVG
jgi:hypothetical protein